MRKGFLAALLLAGLIVANENSGIADDSRSKAITLGETAMRMVVSSSQGMFIGVNYGEELDSNEEETMFRALLEAGADPDLIRITGFVESKVERVDGLKQVSLGRIGAVSSAESGGLTLFEYFKANNIENGCALVKEYESKTKPSIGVKLGSERKSVSTEKLIIQVDFFSGIQGHIKISPDNKRSAYQAKTGDNWFAVIDGKQEKPYDDKYLFLSMNFSPDSQHVVYTATKVNNKFVVMDGVEGKQHSFITIPVFSPDSRHLAYTTTDSYFREKWYVVLDGNDRKTYDDVNNPGMCFSPDSRHLAYPAKENNKWFTVVDGKEGRQYDNVAGIVFSQDSKHIAYEAKAGNKWLAVVDEKEEKQYDDVYGVVFSPDGNHVAYQAKSENKWFVVVDGKEGKPYDEIRGPVFSPDSNHVGYEAKADNKWFAVVDENEWKPYDDKSFFFYLVFSPDSKHIVYFGKMGEKLYSVVDGKEGKAFDKIYDPAFSPDSRHVAYKGIIDNKYFAVIDEKEGKPYDDIRDIVFSPDGNHAAYQAKRDYKWYTVIDGKEGKAYDSSIDIVHSVVFDSNDKLHYLAQKGRCIYLVEEKISGSKDKEPKETAEKGVINKTKPLEPKSKKAGASTH